MPQYITSTLIEDKDDDKPPFEFDATTVQPNLVLRVGGLTVHMTPGRMRALGEFIVAQTQPFAETFAALPSEITEQETPATPFDEEKI